MRISFFGSSLVSAVRHTASAAYYRGLLHALADRGHEITFFEPDPGDRQLHGDANPGWAHNVVYDATEDGALDWAEHASRNADLIIKASGTSELDQLLNRALVEHKRADTIITYWDTTPLATLQRLQRRTRDPLRGILPGFDAVFVNGGGQAVCADFESLGARQCEVVYAALDTAEHFTAFADRRFAGDVGMLCNSTAASGPVEEFFLPAARMATNRRFVLGGSGWDDRMLPDNVRAVGAVPRREQSSFRCSQRALLSINSEAGSADYNPGPAFFDAAGARACLLTDGWAGVELFLEPDREVIVIEDAEDLAQVAQALTSAVARQIGANACRRIRSEHTYVHRAEQVEHLLAALPGSSLAGI